MKCLNGSECLSAGSNLESIGLVLNNVVDAAAIDSSVLQLWMSEHPLQAEELHVMCSWGPWPAQPIVVNARLPGKHSHSLILRIMFTIFDFFSLINPVRVPGL